MPNCLVIPEIGVNAMLALGSRKKTCEHVLDQSAQLQKESAAGIAMGTQAMVAYSRNQPTMLQKMKECELQHYLGSTKMGLDKK